MRMCVYILLYIVCNRMQNSAWQRIYFVIYTTAKTHGQSLNCHWKMMYEELTDDNKRCKMKTVLVESL